MRIGVLGPLEVADANGRPVRVGGHRVRALLILLALDTGRVIPTHALLERLWPGARAHRACAEPVSAPGLQAAASTPPGRHAGRRDRVIAGRLPARDPSGSGR